MLGFEDVTKLSQEYFEGYINPALKKFQLSEFTIVEGYPTDFASNNHCYIDCKDINYSFDNSMKEIIIEMLLFLSSEYEQREASKTLDVIMQTLRSKDKFPSQLPFRSVSFQKYDKVADANIICMVELRCAMPITQLDMF